MLIVGLTGGIATGKSTVSRELSLVHGVPVVDADLLAREVVRPGTGGYRAILKHFSDVEDLVAENGELNRAALGRSVFGNKERLAVLNSIVHPAVRKAIFWRLFKAYISGSFMVVLDVPLLFEAGLYQICGKTVTVSCSEEVQIRRLLSRNPELTEQDAANRIASQMSNQERNYRADVVIDNSGELDELKKAVASVVREIRPLTVMSVLDLIPPIGLLSAIYTYMVRFAGDYYKRKRL